MERKMENVFPNGFCCVSRMIRNGGAIVFVKKKV